jgi:uncharacterized protein (TIGR03437 family)
MVYAVGDYASAVAPFWLAGRANTTIRVEVDGQLSNAVTLPVVATKPGIFSLNQSGTGQGAVLNPDYSVNGPANPVARWPDSYVQIYLTGGGITNPAGVDGGLVGSPLPVVVANVSVTIGGQNVPVYYAGGAPGLVHGVIQINAGTAGVPTGAAVPVTIIIGGVASQAGITIAVQ